MNYNPATPLVIIVGLAAVFTWIKLCYAVGDWLEYQQGWRSSTAAVAVITLLFLPAILVTGFIV